MKMPNRSNFIILLVLVFSTSGMGQSIQESILAKVIDSNSGNGLFGATVLNLQTGEGTITDSLGIFTLDYQDSKNIVSIQYLGYFSRSFSIESLPQIIKMETNSEIISELTIYAERIPQDLTTDYETIKDFVISEDRVLMISKRKGKDDVLKLADLDGKVLHIQSLPNISNVENLFTSCFGTNFLIGEYEVLQLHTSEDSIFIVDKDSRQRFDQYIVPCLAITDEYIYQEKRSSYNQAASILAINREKQELFVFASVDDEENLERLPYDRKYMDYANGTGPLYLGVHASHSSSPAVNARAAAQWGTLLSRSFYLPVDYFFFPNGDTILLFDHEKHVLTKYSQEGENYAHYPITYSQESGWKAENNILVDLARNDIYAVHRKASESYFTRINLSNAQNEEKYKVHTPFVEKMIIHRGNLYFTNSSIVVGKGSRILKKVELDN